MLPRLALVLLVVGVAVEAVPLLLLAVVLLLVTGVGVLGLLAVVTGLTCCWPATVTSAWSVQGGVGGVRQCQCVRRHSKGGRGHRCFYPIGKQRRGGGAR